MNVIKRSGSPEPVQFDKITRRLEHLCKDLGDINVQKSHKMLLRKCLII